MDGMKKKTWIFLLIPVLLAIYVVFVPPVGGVQDDGTVYSILTENGLYQTDVTANFNRTYGILPNGPTGAGTTPIGLVKGLMTLFGSTVFPVGVLSGIYILLFAFGLFLAFSKMAFDRPWQSTVIMALTVLIFADAGYLSYFNSITYEGAALAYFTLLLGTLFHMAQSETPKVWEILLATVSAFLFCGSAKFLFFLMPIAAVLLVRYAFARKEVWWKVLSLFLAVLFVVGSSMVYARQSIPNESVRRYQAVYYGVLKGASETETADAIQYLGLPENTKALAGTTYYDSVDGFSSEEKDEISARISYGKIAGYYVSHPSALLRYLRTASANAYFVKQDYLGYFEWNDSYKIELSVWNTVKRMLPIQNFFIMLALWIAMTVLSFVERKKGKSRLFDTGLWVLLSAAVTFFLPSVFFGEAQISKTMFPFGMFFDATIILLAAWGIDTILKRQKKAKEQYGLSQ